MIFRSPYPDSTIPEVAFSDYVFADLRRHADRPAFIDGPSGRTLTHGQVHGGARKMAAALVQRGLRKGEVFAIFCPNLPEYAVAFHGVAMAGGVVTTASPLAPAEELAFQLNDAGACYVLTVPPFLGVAREVAARAKVREIFVIAAPGTPTDGATPFSALLAHDLPPPAVEIDPRSDLLVLPYSSGTTGRPKGVMLTHFNGVAALEELTPIGDGYDLSSDERAIAVIPFFHIYGMQAMLNGTLRFGRTCVTMPRFDLEQFLGLVQRYRINQLWAVPPVIQALARHPVVERFDLSSLTRVGSGGAPLAPAAQQRARERLGLDVGQGYGITESGFGVAVERRGSMSGKPGSCGRLLRNMQMRVVDPASGAELGPNQDGELLIRSPAVMRGYLNQPEATRAMFDADGWMHTGDLGHVDGDGEVFIVDRIKELIKYKAYQVAPATLEAVLLQHPAVAEAAVIGVPDDEAGEVPKAFVVARAAVPADEIIAFVATRVAPHERVRQLEFVAEIPRTPAGKILRRVLRARAAVAAVG